MSDDNAFLVEDDGPIRHFRFNRPKQLNALDLDQHVRMLRNAREADADPNVRVIVLSGEGRAFCAGDDLAARSTSTPPELAGRQVDLALGIGPVMLLDACAALRSVGKPTVALLHGHALGSGYDYSLSCDFRVAAVDVNYGDPRIHRALWAAEGWSYKLPRQLNQAAVTPIAYLGETMNGSQAYDRGLVHRVYPAGSDLRQAARPFLLELAALDAAAYRAGKRRLLESQELSFGQAQRLG